MALLEPQQLHECLRTNHHKEVIDFLWGAFSSAATSYKADSLLRPFPPMFIKDNGDKDLDNLRRIVTSMPNVQSVANKQIRLSSSQSDLLQWVLQSLRTQIHLSTLDRLAELQALTGENITLPPPQYFFELEHSEQSQTTFLERTSDKRIIYAYHGSKAENFYSILHHGLHSHMNKTSLFGEGTYLCIEPTVAMGFSPWAATNWSNSSIGDSMSVIALCEVIDHPSVKHTSSRERVDGAVGTRAPNSMGGDVPDKYIVVTNDEMVRVKYLLVYAKTVGTGRSQASTARDSTISRRMAVTQWLHRHSNIVPIIFYVTLLIFIGLMSSKRFWRRVLQVYEETFDGLEQTTTW